MLDLDSIRRDFPILEKGVIYFDNAASSLTPEQVVLKDLFLRSLIWSFTINFPHHGMQAKLSMDTLESSP